MAYRRTVSDLLGHDAGRAILPPYAHEDLAAEVRPEPGLNRSLKIAKNRAHVVALLRPDRCNPALVPIEPTP
jgi:hypothetical protein